MINSIRGTRGMAVAPHAAAAQSALAVLREGGNALEAMIAAAATIAVVYPHMNSIGGDSFWLIHVPGKAPGAIDACGAAAQAASREWYAGRGITTAIPFRGGVAANTVAGTISGWGAAYQLSRRTLRGRMPLARLLEDAIHYARRGIVVTASQAVTTANKKAELAPQPGFAGTFLVDGEAPASGSVFVQKRLGATLDRIARFGTEDFYRGELARSIATDLARAGSPLSAADLAAHRVRLVDPLALEHSAGTLLNMTPPTQGLVSLLILGILDELEIGKAGPATADYVHLCVEATKQAFRVRDRYITDPAYMTVDPRDLLKRDHIRELAARIDRRRAAPWGAGRGPADTVWMGVIDGQGRAVSFIQSIYHEFGSRRGARGIRHQLAEPRLQLFSRSQGAQYTRARQKAVPYAQSGAGAAQGRTHHGLWHHGRRRPAADPVRGVHAHRRPRHGSAGRGERTALAARPHLGPDQRHAQARIALRHRRGADADQLGPRSRDPQGVR